MMSGVERCPEVRLRPLPVTDLLHGSRRVLSCNRWYFSLRGVLCLCVVGIPPLRAGDKGYPLENTRHRFLGLGVSRLRGRGETGVRPRGKLPILHRRRIRHDLLHSCALVPPTKIGLNWTLRWGGISVPTSLSTGLLLSKKITRRRSSDQVTLSCFANIQSGRPKQSLHQTQSSSEAGFRVLTPPAKT